MKNGGVTIKFGILFHKNTQNIGDDIQAFAASCFLPQIDYFVDREQLDAFESTNNEPVAVIMGGWYMWAKWNWPPSHNIIPNLVSIHYDDHQISGEPGSPIKFEYLTGIGADYLKAYGPVGCRDMFTLENLQKLDIDAYFSGCITLTLPQMPRLETDREYVCLVDLNDEVENHVKNQLEGKNIEIKIISHNLDYRNSELTWQERSKCVVELLTLYQNAKCVLTKRLHCALPCLALGVPVLLLINNMDSIRFNPYLKWLNHAKPREFIAGEYEYNVFDPKSNPSLHYKTRRELSKSIEAFVNTMSNENVNTSQPVKTAYSHQDVLVWQNSRMKQSLDLWLKENRLTVTQNKKYKNEIGQKNAEIKVLKSTLANQNADLASKKKKLDAQEKTISKQLLLLNSRTVKLALKIRRFVSKVFKW